jgi:hypothetical protein
MAAHQQLFFGRQASHQHAAKKLSSLRLVGFGFLGLGFFKIHTRAFWRQFGFPSRADGCSVPLPTCVGSKVAAAACLR